MIKTPGRGQRVADALAADRLGGGAVLSAVMAAAAPLTMVAGLVVTAFAVTGNTGLPLAFVVVGAVLAVFSAGYTAMSRHLHHAGAFYSQAAAGLGGAVGVAGAWVALVAYSTLQVALYGIIGSAAAPLLADGGLAPPWWLVALAAWAVVALLGVLRIEVSGRILTVLLTGEIAVTAVYALSWLAHPAHGIAWGMLSPAHLGDSGIGAVLAIATLSFVGFETSVTLSEEVRDHGRTIPRATLAAIVAFVLLYGGAALAMGTTVGVDQLPQAAARQGPDLVFALAAQHLGSGMATLGRALFVTSVLAAMISFHTTIARYVYALGRERVLPHRFSRTARTGAPWAASLAQTTIGLTVIVTFAVGGWDPVVNLFYIGGGAGSLGIIVLLTTAAAAVLAYFHRDARGENAWHTTVAPGLALVALLVGLYLVLANFAGLLGVAPDSPLRWGIPLVYAAVAVAGLGYGLFLRRTRPQVYAGIGHGTAARGDAVPAYPGPYRAAAFAPNGPLPDEERV